MQQNKDSQHKLFLHIKLAVYDFKHFTREENILIGTLPSNVCIKI